MTLITLTSFMDQNSAQYDRPIYQLHRLKDACGRSLVPLTVQKHNLRAIIIVQPISNRLLQSTMDFIEAITSSSSKL